MKKIYKILMLLVLLQLSPIFGEPDLLVSSANAAKTNYNVNSEKVLLTANGYNYTEGHFNKELRFVEFLLGTPISATERQEGWEETAINFNSNPAGFLQEVNKIDAQMQQIYRITDVAQIGRTRSALISQIYAGAQNMQGGEQPFIVKLLYKYVPVLAIDSQNMLAFTYKDFEAYIYLMQFNAQMSGQNVQFTPQQISEMKNYLVQQFYYMTLEQKQNLCGMQIQYEYISKIYDRMTPQQKQQWQNQMLSQQASQYQNSNGQGDAFARGYNQAQQNSSYDVQWPEGVNNKAEKQAYLQKMRSNMNSNAASMNIYHDTMMGNHATMLNTIENFGDTGVYWEYK